jgi:hypothetical protein
MTAVKVNSVPLQSHTKNYIKKSILQQANIIFEALHVVYADLTSKYGVTVMLLLPSVRNVTVG